MEPPTNTMSGGPCPPTWYARWVAFRTANWMRGGASMSAGFDPGVPAHPCSVTPAIARPEMAAASGLYLTSASHAHWVGSDHGRLDDDDADQRVACPRRPH